jgi:hypothetical protein
MAVTTVSSLTESFTSGVPVPNEDVGVSKEKTDAMDIVTAGPAGDVGVKNAKDSEHAQTKTLTHTADEFDDSDFEVLEVHD